MTRSSSRPTTYAHGLITASAPPARAGLGAARRCQQPSAGRAGAGPGAGAPKPPLERARSAESRARLEDEDAAARAREVRSGREPVVAAADDDGVPLAGGQ